MQAWHVAITKPFFGLIAEENLRQQDFQVFNPKCRVAKIVRGQRVITERPYIPGYIFVRFDAGTDNWEPINWTRGIETLMYGTWEKPARVRDDAIQLIIDRCDGGYVKEEEIDLAWSKLIPIGSTVRMVEGPFAGHSGKVTWSKDDRVRVLMTLLGGQRELKMKSASVEVVA